MVMQDTLEKNGRIQSKGYNPIRQEPLVPERDQELEPFLTCPIISDNS